MDQGAEALEKSSLSAVLTIIRKTYRLLTPAERRSSLAICAAVVVAAIVDVLSLTAIMPFMAVIVSPAGGQRLPLVAGLRDWLAPSSDRTLILVVGGLCLGLIVLSAVLSVLTRYAVIEFTYTRYHTLTKRLFEAYLGRPYAFFLARNSSKLSESVISDCKVVVSKIILSLLLVFSNAVVALGIVLALFVVEPALATAAFVVVGGLYLVIYRILRRLVHRIGHQRQAVSGEHVAIVNQAFRGIKELKLFGAEHYFTERYARYSREIARTTGQAVALAELPRKVIETIAIGGALAVMLVAAAQRGGVHDQLPLIALFVFAAYKLLPSVQQIFQHLVKIRFYAPTMHALHDELVMHPNQDEPTPKQRTGCDETPPAGTDITFDQVSFSYEGASQPALEKVSFHIPVGSLVAFVGATGSGKSTAVGLLLGLLKPGQGQIRMGGRTLDTWQIRCWQRRIGYVPQAIALLDDTVARNIAFGKDTPDLERVSQVASIAQIRSVVLERLSDGFATQIGENGVRLSGGERQRLGIARALYNDPVLLVLDEATSALDNTTERAVIEQIQAMGSGKTIVMVAHRLHTIRQCDWVFYFERGRVVGAGHFNDLSAHCAGFAALLASAQDSVEPSP